MMTELCQFSLIFPSWLGWSLGGFGLALVILGYLFLATGTRSGTADKFSLKLGIFEASTGTVSATIVVGLLLLLLGVAFVTSERYQPFARWIGSIMSSLVDKKDPSANGEFNDETMASIGTNLGYSGLYVVHITDAAKRERVTGSYENQRCYAELVSQICRQESQRLFCKVDSATRSIAICRRTLDPGCGETQ